MLICVVEFIFCGITVLVGLDFYMIRPFENIDSNFNRIILSLFRCNFAATYLMMCAFYMVFHALQNLFAELTRFADREFYQVIKDSVLSIIILNDFVGLVV